MPDDVKISEMSEAASLDNSAQFPYVQSMNGNLTTLKAPLSQIGTKINEGMTFSNLQTTSKNIVGAINEAAQGGGVDYATELPISSTDPTDTKSYIDTKTTLVKSASGSLIHITDGGDNIPVKSLVSEIVAVESGNGQPKSPTNPYSISGFSQADIVVRASKNFFDKTTVTGGYRIGADGNPFPQEGYSISDWIETVPNIPIVANVTFSAYDGLAFYDSSKTFIERITSGTTVRVPTNAKYIRVAVNNSYLNTYQLQYGTTSTTYEAYSDKINTYTFAFGQTVYGGHFDNKGNLVVTHGYIASYNGESINEPWISSMDNYVPNTSPSTSAQVVYPLTTPITLAITSQDIPTLSGENNIFSNCGDLDIEYFTSSADEVAELIRKQPAPLHHYSLGEVEIGTWIDGSTIYEKTIDIAQYSVTAEDTQFTDLVAIANIDFLVSAEIHKLPPNVGQLLRFNVSNNYIQVASITTINLSAFDNLPVTFRYTKSV